MYCLYLNLIYRNFLFSQNSIFIPIHVVPLHDFSNSSYTTCRLEKPLRGFSIGSYTKYAFEKPLRGFYTYTFEKPIRGFSIWSYPSYTFENPLRGFSKNYASKNQNNFVFRIMCWKWRWDKLNGYFNFSTANFFRGTKSIENSKESVIPEFKKPLILSYQYKLFAANDMRSMFLVI